ncbi:MAG: MFS transporter [Anaerolineaceae bacterium]|nr:MFS transporter [Anaerolineaceae bacterium]
MSDDGRRRQLFAIGFLGFVALGTPVAALGVAWAQMQRGFGVSLESLGLVMVALLLGRVLVSVYSGNLASRMGVGNYLLAGSLLMLTGFAGVATASGLLPLIALHTLLGVGVTVLNTGINIHAAAHYSGGRMNLLHTGFGLGSALGPLIVTLVVFQLGLNWRWSYVIFFLPQLGLTLLLARTRQSWKLNGKPASGESAQPLRRSLRLAPVWFGMLLFFLHGGIQHGAGALGNSLMIDGRGIAPDQAGLWVSIFWAGLTIGRVLTGVLVERIGNNRFMRFSMLLTIVGTLLFQANLGESPTFAGIALIGLTLAPVLPLLLADTPGRVGAAHSPNTVGLQIGSSGVGMAILPALMAVVAERVGLETIGVGLLLIALLSFLVHEGLLALERRLALPASLSPAP